LVFFGVRLGGALATLAAAEHGGVDGLLLWSPVVEGQGYLRDLATQHEAFFTGSFAQRNTTQKTNGSGDEALGFAIAPALRSDLNRLDLRSLERAPAPRAVLLADAGERGVLAQRLDELGVQLEPASDSVPPIWLKQGDGLGDAMVPADAIAVCLESLERWFS
jgi:pimeloyl-ACP methyl ester carboxylesterase